MQNNPIAKVADFLGMAICAIIYVVFHAVTFGMMAIGGATVIYCFASAVHALLQSYQVNSILAWVIAWTPWVLISILIVALVVSNHYDEKAYRARRGY